MTVAGIHLAAGVAVCLTSLVSIQLLRRAAGPLSLIDHPGGRKQHDAPVPMVGGLAIFTGLLVGAAWPGVVLDAFTRNWLLTAAIMVLVGALDDRHDLSVRARVIIQALVCTWLVRSTGVEVHDLGRWGELHLTVPELLRLPFTVIAVIGLVNAFNMIDGLNGLAGSVYLIAVLGMATLGDTGVGMMTVAMLALASLPYLAHNLGMLGRGRRIFLGDAGSVLLGYALAWALIRSSQGDAATLRPSQVLWCVAIPVMDTLAVMARRMVHGQSPFKPDRGHVHHLLLRSGLRPRDVLLTLILAGVAAVGVGQVLQHWWPGMRGLAFVLIGALYAVVAAMAHGKLRKEEQAPPAPPILRIISDAQSLPDAEVSNEPPHTVRTVAKRQLP